MMRPARQRTSARAVPPAWVDRAGGRTYPRVRSRAVSAYAGAVACIPLSYRRLVRSVSPSGAVRSIPADGQGNGLQLKFIGGGWRGRGRQRRGTRGLEGWVGRLELRRRGVAELATGRGVSRSRAALKLWGSLPTSCSLQVAGQSQLRRRTGGGANFLAAASLKQVDTFGGEGNVVAARPCMPLPVYGVCVALGNRPVSNRPHIPAGNVVDRGLVTAIEVGAVLAGDSLGSVAKAF